MVRQGSGNDSGQDLTNESSTERKTKGIKFVISVTLGGRFMSYTYWGCKINAPAEQVTKALEKFTAVNKGDLSKIDLEAVTDDDSICLKIAPLGTSTLIGWNRSGLSPELVLFLSGNLPAHLLCVDLDERIGYQHFSELRDGGVVSLFSAMDTEQEEVNIDLNRIVDIARRKESATHARMVENAPQGYIFEMLLADNTLQNVFQDELLDNEGGQCFRLQCPGLGKRCMGPDSGTGDGKIRFWTELTALTV